MNITFEKLTKQHFPLLLKWLEAEHVKKWWDSQIEWNAELIREKYSKYCEGFKEGKPIYAFIIKVDHKEIGYIQYYDYKDFCPQTTYSLDDIPESCAAIDIYIGEANYLGKNIGSKSIKLLIKEHISNHFAYSLIDPDTKNIAAVKSYLKAGFKIVKEESGITLLIADNLEQ